MPGNTTIFSLGQQGNGIAVPDDLFGPVRGGFSSSTFPGLGRATTSECTADLAVFVAKVMIRQLPSECRKGLPDVIRSCGSVPAAGSAGEAVCAASGERAKGEREAIILPGKDVGNGKSGKFRCFVCAVKR